MTPASIRPDHNGQRCSRGVLRLAILVALLAANANAQESREPVPGQEINDRPSPLATNNSAVNVPCWEMHEFMASARANVENPYRDAACVGEFVSPSGRKRVVEGFYDGGDTWRLRFAPDEVGDWTYTLRGQGVEILRTGTLRCSPARGPGFICIHPENPYAFAHSDGSPFFPLGDTCYGLFDDSPITPEMREQYLRTRRAQRFNFVRMTVGHSESRAAADPAYWAWGGTVREPDLDRFNPEFFRRFDALMEMLHDKGMNVELILLNFYRKPFTDVESWTPDRERQWLRYLLARYGAYDNVFLWTIANEYETHPDGVYRLDRPSDVEWAAETARFIKANDPHGHLVTIHPVVSASAKGESPRAEFSPPWRIGEFFGNTDGIDVLSQQTGQFGDGTEWDAATQSWTGDSATLVDSVQSDRRYGKPVLNSENGYEYEPGGPTSKRQVHSTDKVRRTSWRIVCAGGYFAAGFHGTLGHNDAWNRIDAPNRYTFRIEDGGAAPQLSILYRFFAKLPYWRMQPLADVGRDAVAMADPGRVYLAYLPHGGSVELDLSRAEGALYARWFNPRTGELGLPSSTAGGGKQSFAAPDAEDWALVISKKDLAADAP